MNSSADIYENLPCQSDQPSLKVEEGENELLLTKEDLEDLYATPLRKSERPKSSPRNNPDPISEKEDEVKAETCKEEVNAELEDQRIRSFIKDTTQMHKRMEMQKDLQKENNSSFSYLARKEHFANLVQQNIINKDSYLEKTVEKQDTELIGIEKVASICQSAQYSPSRPRFEVVELNREWVLKKIAICLEQRAVKKPIPVPPGAEGMDLGQAGQPSNLPPLGYLVLGSSGSGKTTICRDIQCGITGTKGLLNRRLLACYFVNSTDQECHYLSTFIRSVVLQILSHSSYHAVLKEAESCEKVENLPEADQVSALDRMESKFVNGASESSILDKELEEIIKEELKLQEQDSKIRRQKSEQQQESGQDVEAVNFYGTHPPVQKGVQEVKECKSQQASPNKKVSKIPVPKAKVAPSLEKEKSPDKEPEENQSAPAEVENSVLKNGTLPPPIPKHKSVLTQIADAYYELLSTNQDVLEALNVEKIEKNPDDCFKKVLLFPLLEINPPKTAQLLLIDSIDEIYLNESSIVSTLKGKVSAKSRTIAELLSNHIHLFPKWLFLVCTAKKQNKSITKLFTGFKKLTLDDLRKSQVVKDVQQYIINRLNSDFRGINLTKDIIESLNQLYIKSNGSILYLYKVLTGIKDNFFTFREIKLIPCTLNGLYLYICQKSFNKKQYSKVKPILNILLVCNGYAEKDFVFKCLQAHNYTIDRGDFERRLEILRNVVEVEGDRVRIFHNSFCEWLIDVKFSTKKFLCDIQEGHIMVGMYYTLTSESICANKVRYFIYHLIRCGEFMAAKGVTFDTQLILLESRVNLRDGLTTSALSCCKKCRVEYESSKNFSAKVRQVVDKYLLSELGGEFKVFLNEFFKPHLPVNSKVLKLLIESGVSVVHSSSLSRESSVNSPVCLSENASVNIDSELADLLISSEKSCLADLAAEAPKKDPEQNTLRLDGLEMELQRGKALIHLLANEGNHVLLERALKACTSPVDLEIEDLNGQTALNIAARNGHSEIVRLLLNYVQVSDSEIGVRGVDVNHPDRDGWSPLRSASWGGHTEVVKMLIGHPACAIDQCDKENRTALRAAAWSGNEDIVKILIEAGANVNSVDKQGRTSLIAASYMGHYEIVEILLENGADVNHTDLDGRSALCVAALCGNSGYSKVISTLLEYGAKTDQTDNEGMSPLLVSSFEGNAEICELLLENYADPDLADHMNRTPLWAACTSGHASVVKLLLFWGCGIDCMDSEGRTVLSVAAAQGNLESVRQLLDRGLDEMHRDNAGWTPLHYAAFEGYAEICIQLIEAGAKIDECDNEGKTALHLAAQEGHKEVIDAILRIYRYCVDLKAHDGKTSLRLACLEGHFDCVEALIKYGADVNICDADSRSTLYILALENKFKMVKFFLEISNVNTNIPDSEGRTALHVAAWQGHTEMVKLLITEGQANVNAMDLEFRSPLHSCAWQGNSEVMRLLLYYGAVADHACKQGATALGISAQEGHEECVRILLQFGANPFKSDHCGRTPIKLAAKSNRNGVLKLLEEYTKKESDKLRPTAPTHTGTSPEKPLPHIPKHSPNGVLVEGGLLVPHTSVHSSSAQNSSNFYENTMNSANSSILKRKSVISSQSTGSSNEVSISFTQQLQKHSRHHNVRGNQVLPTQENKSQQKAKHSQVLSNVDEYQVNMRASDDLGWMSPLYASPPHSPSSDISSPGQEAHFNGPRDTIVASNQHDTHFARDTHMKIILGNAQKEREAKEAKEQSKAKKSTTSNPAMRLIRNRFDAAANLVRRTPNILNMTSGSSQGSSSIGVKSSTFQWRKESQM